jgi:hypothetical protein
MGNSGPNVFANPAAGLASTPASVQIQIDTPARSVTNYTGVLGSPRVIQFTVRYEF